MSQLIKKQNQTKVMNTNYYSLIVLLAPLAFVLFGIVSLIIPKNKVDASKSWSEPVALFGIITAAIAAFLTWNYGTISSSLLGFYEIGFSVRLDALSVIMFSMIAILGYIVIKYSKNYLDGDTRQKTFMARLAFTIASVQLMVVSGNLGQLFITWMLTSLTLHQLLVFYKGRPGAIIAARKKFIVARLGDVLFLVSTVLLYYVFGTGDLNIIFSGVEEAFKSGFTLELEIATICIALVAILKSAQFPTHGWLIEVVETPTPVSALLHAGLLNAGPFLIIRMAFLMNEATYAPIFLILMGGFTALFASIVFLTQSSVKVALGYSSIAHMGFMLLICGFGVYTAAMLHLVAHSFYKAHAFLSSGSVIDVVRANKVKLPTRLGSNLRIVSSIAVALGVYIIMAKLWNIDPVKEFTLLATGAVIIMGLSQIIVPVLDTKTGIMGILKAIGMAGIVALSFFSLEHLFEFLLHSQIPEISQPSTLIVVLTSTVILIFGIAVFIQLIAPTLKKSKLAYIWGVHFKNGFYANAYFDRLVRSLHNEDFSKVSLEIIEEDHADQYLKIQDDEKKMQLQTVVSELK